MELIEDIQVIKIIAPKILGVHQGKLIYLYTGKFGEYLKHDGHNYTIPDLAKKEMINLSRAINIIEWMNNDRNNNREVISRQESLKIIIEIHIFKNHKKYFTLIILFKFKDDIKDLK